MSSKKTFTRRILAALIPVIVAWGPHGASTSGASKPTPSKPTPTSTPTSTPTATSTPTSTAASSQLDTLMTTLFPYTPVDSIFGASSAWRLPVAKAPLNTNSKAMVANLTQQVDDYWGGTAAFNYDRYGVSVYSVPKGQPRADVVYDNCQNKTEMPVQLYQEQWGAHFKSVPIPDDAKPSPGSDGQLTIWSPSSDQLWEFWQAKRVDGAWHACWGGRIDNVSKSQGYFPNYTGASASGMAVSAGALSLRDLQQGRANHALSLAIIKPAVWTNFSYPAQRSDGWDTASDAIPEGIRFRLDPTVDVDSLPLTKIGKIVAHAAQDYGFIVTDRSGAVAVSAESSEGMVAAGMTDPYPKLLGGEPGWTQMRNFPWSKLQALPMDYGKPSS